MLCISVFSTSQSESRVYVFTTSFSSFFQFILFFQFFIFRKFPPTIGGFWDFHSPLKFKQRLAPHPPPPLCSVQRYKTEIKETPTWKQSNWPVNLVHTHEVPSFASFLFVFSSPYIYFFFFSLSPPRWWCCTRKYLLHLHEGLHPEGPSQHAQEARPPRQGVSGAAAAVGCLFGLWVRGCPPHSDGHCVRIKGGGTRSELFLGLERWWTVIYFIVTCAHTPWTLTLSTLYVKLFYIYI